MAGVEQDRYQLLERLGAGGTWLAQDLLLGRRVAMKDVSGSPDQPAVARLDHPGIIHVYDLVRWNDAPWIITEYVPAGSLHDAAPLTHRAAARIGLEVLAALRVVHAAGLRHGNVKPQNILLADDGRVILTDFGGSSEDLPALGAALRTATGGLPGPLTPLIDALQAPDPDRYLEPMLRIAATERAIGVSRVPSVSVAPSASRAASAASPVACRRRAMRSQPSKSGSMPSAERRRREAS